MFVYVWLWRSQQTCVPSHFKKHVLDRVQLAFISFLVKELIISDIHIVFI